VTHLPRACFEPVMLLRAGDPMAERYRAEGMVVEEFRLIPPRRALEWTKLARFFVNFWPSTLRLARAMRRWNADAVHVNTLFNVQGAVAARLARRPLVWHIRELVPGSRAAGLMLRLVPLLATRAVAISTAVSETLAACGERVQIVFDGIDLEPLEEADGERGRGALGLEAGQPLVVTVGRIEPWKGQRTLIEAAPAILAAFPEARILIVGGPAVNKPEYAEGLRQRCEELGVAGRVCFTGIRDDVPDILAAADVLVLPSATPEPFGLTVAEAMAVGCPVVATAAGGPLDTVVDGETGYLVPPESPDAVAEKVCVLLADPKGARAMGDRGRVRVRERFTIERVADEMGMLLERITGVVGPESIGRLTPR